MNITSSVKVRKNSISKVVRGVKVGVDGATWRTAEMMLREMQARARRHKQATAKEAGELSIYDSLRVEGKEGDETVQVGSVGAHRGRPVARFIEMGTRHNRAYPFARPAAARGRKMLKEEAEADVKRVADTA